MEITKGMLVDVWDAYLYDDKDNVIFMSENLTSSDVTGKADESEVRNGKGNALFAKLYSNKTIDVSLKTNAFSFDMIALLAGTTVATGSNTCFYECKTYTVVSGKITLDEEPKYPTKLNVYKGNTKLSSVTQGTTNKKEFTVTGATDGDEVKVMPYEFDCTDADLQTIEIKADEFPSACKLVLTGYYKSNKNKITDKMVIEIPKATVSSDFSLSTSSEVKAVESEIKLSAMSDNGKLVKITKIPIAEA